MFNKAKLSVVKTYQKVKYSRNRRKIPNFPDCNRLECSNQNIIE